MGASLRIGHIDLAASIRDEGEHLVRLTETLAHAGHAQHIVVANAALARRLRHVEGVTVGPVTGTAIVACCLMQDVDVVHGHEPQAGRAALLMLLTRSIPYVLTERGRELPGRTSIGRSALGRAATVICSDDATRNALVGEYPKVRVELIPDINRDSLDEHPMDELVARAHVLVYRQAIATRQPSMRLL